LCSSIQEKPVYSRDLLKKKGTADKIHSAFATYIFTLPKIYFFVKGLYYKILLYISSNNKKFIFFRDICHFFV